jgi:CxxC-x17-CxxC domain-containing protein
MFEGNWTCSGCGGTITSLPFEPRRTDGLLCRECHQKQKGGAAPRSNSSDRPRVEGNWTCSGCGGTITSLPFMPRDTSNLKCIDCFKKSRAA